MKRTALLLALCLSLAFTLYSCASVGGAGDDSGNMDIVYFTDDDGNRTMKRNGTETKTVEVNSRPRQVEFEIQRASGEINILIYPGNDKGSSVYEGNNVELTGFTVTLSEPGNYTVLITCNEFVGNYTAILR